MSPRWRRIALAAVAMPLAVLINVQSVWAAYACRIDGQVRDACCCPKKMKDRDRAPSNPAPSIAASCCCDVTVAESSAAPQALKIEAARAGDNSLALAATTNELTVMVPVSVRVPWQVFPRPPPRPIPTYLANRSILR